MRVGNKIMMGFGGVCTALNGHLTGQMILGPLNGIYVQLRAIIIARTMSTIQANSASSKIPAQTQVNQAG